MKKLQIIFLLLLSINLYAQDADKIATLVAGNPGETDHPKPEQTDHLKGWRRLPNFAGEDFQFCADFML